jgi:dipeptidyl aminopeptidase/acylaminoacyl peptidase
MKKLTKASLGLIILSAIALPHVSQADEINYATVEKTKGQKISVRYNGPSGEVYFLCDLNNFECSGEGSSSPDFTPEILGEDDYITSPDGNFGLVSLGAGSGAPLYVLYDLTESVPSFQTLIPYQKPVSKILFAPSSQQVLIFGTGGEIIRYDIHSRKSFTTQASQSEFPQRIISPNGRYVSAYNYTKEAHLIWDVESGSEIVIPSESPSYVEFSENEQNAMFTDTATGFDSLYVTNMGNSNEGATLIAGEDSTVVDYLFVNNNVYYISNEETPYNWNLYRLDPNSGEKEKIAENVSYGDYLKRINDKLVFLVIEGKNTNVAIHDPASGETEIFRPVGESPLPSSVKRSVIKNDGIYSALLEPENSRDNEDILFIWLHGGPQRQTSPGYHSYLSYAVYDELLDRLVENGATVLKLDYTGSFGYGKEFIDELKENIGKVDVNDVLEAAEELEDDKDFDQVYLIGNSYGGYLALRTLVEDPNAFKGAVGINGVYDWESLIRRIPSSPFRTLFNGLPVEENASLYAEANIANRLDELSRDDEILLFYGEKDFTVPTWQTTEFAQELEKEKLDYEVVSFPDEAHVLKERDTLNALCEKIMNLVNLNDRICRN